jgi:hypothetical protein
MGKRGISYRSPLFPQYFRVLVLEQIYSHQADLDKDPLLRGRPISLDRIDGHAALVSYRVLELMGPIPSTVEGGTIIRDANGNPSGMRFLILHHHPLNDSTLSRHIR